MEESILGCLDLFQTGPCRCLQCEMGQTDVAGPPRNETTGRPTPFATRLEGHGQHLGSMTDKHEKNDCGLCGKACEEKDGVILCLGHYTKCLGHNTKCLGPDMKGEEHPVHRNAGRGVIDQ